MRGSPGAVPTNPRLVDRVFVVLGYGPPAHFPVDWAEQEMALEDPSRAVLCWYLGRAEVIKREVEWKLSKVTLEEEA